MAITIPPDAECCMIPRKWLTVLQSIAHGPFLPIDFPLPIVVSAMIPDDEIWFCKTSQLMSTEGDIEVIKKEKTDESMFKTIDAADPSSEPKQLCGPTEDNNQSPDGSDSESGPVMGLSSSQPKQDSDN